MPGDRSWASYPDTYRAREMQILASWIRAGESGSVVGLTGCGRSNLLAFLCHRPDILPRYLPQPANQVLLVPVEIHNLPANDLANLYRTLLHAFYWLRGRFEPATAQTITDLYLENRPVQDAFLPQQALYDLVLLFQQQQQQIVLVLNRFDRFCATAPPGLVSTLRSLRDNFKNTLSYIVGMQREAIYLPDAAALGDMYDLLDTHVCWVGAMAEPDARFMLASLFYGADRQPTAAEIDALLGLSGCFPSLLKAVGQWWLLSNQRPAKVADWYETLLAEHSLQFRLDRIWNGLTQEEKLALSEVQKGTFAAPPPKRPTGMNGQFDIYSRLEARGVCQRTGAGWRVAGKLLDAYVGRVEGRVRGKIWLDEPARAIYQGQVALDELSGLQYEILRFLIKNPRTRHTRDDVIDNAWPEEDQRAGITPNALQVHIAAIRKKIEPNPATPRYLLTWHGRPGGYQFFPEGKPE
jgi:hypothetical protein